MRSGAFLFQCDNCLTDIIAYFFKFRHFCSRLLLLPNHSRKLRNGRKNNPLFAPISSIFPIKEVTILTPISLLCRSLSRNKQHQLSLRHMDHVPCIRLSHGQEYLDLYKNEDRCTNKLSSLRQASSYALLNYSLSHSSLLLSHL